MYAQAPILALLKFNLETNQILIRWIMLYDLQYQKYGLMLMNVNEPSHME